MIFTYELIMTKKIDRNFRLPFRPLKFNFVNFYIKFSYKHSMSFKICPELKEKSNVLYGNMKC